MLETEISAAISSFNVSPETIQIMVNDWPLATFPAGCLFMGLGLFVLVFRQHGKSRDFLLGLQLIGFAAYFFHQFEEHNVDALGRRYYFQTFMCNELGYEDIASCPVTKNFIFAVNVAAVWGSGFLAVLLVQSCPLAGLVFYGIPFVNSFAHIVPAINQQAYNPGLMTALSLFIPCSIIAFHAVLSNHFVSLRGLAFVICAAVLLHLIMILSLLSFARGFITEEAMCTIQALFAFLPLVVWVFAKDGYVGVDGDGYHAIPDGHGGDVEVAPLSLPVAQVTGARGHGYHSVV